MLFRSLSTISTSYATGAVSGSNYIGGLVGISFGTISASYATTGAVSGAGAARSFFPPCQRGTRNTDFSSTTDSPAASEMLNAIGCEPAGTDP